jgi:RHS repeat-associated protein
MKEYKMLTNSNKIKTISCYFSLLVCTAFSLNLQANVMNTLDVETHVSQGRFSFALPLDVPAGVADHQPNLSVNYNENTGNGVLGLGMRLSGQSSIYRCSATQWVDGKHGAMTLTAQDDFCMDGQRIVPTQGSKGGNGTQYTTSEQSFTRVVSIGQVSEGPEYWEVTHKSGERMVYGQAAASVDKVEGSGAIVRWRITDHYDRNGNRIQYTYLRQGNTSVLGSIDYAHFKINLVFEERSDQQLAYLAGVQTKLNKRVQKIQILRNNAVNYNYQFNYVTNNGFSRLADVRWCAADSTNSCAKPTLLSWADESGQDIEADGSSGQQAQFSQIPNDFKTYNMADINRDGISDMCYMDASGLQCATGQQSQLPETFSLWSSDLANSKWQKFGVYQTLTFTDLNADRYPDYCITDEGGTYCGLNNQGTGFTSGKYWHTNTSDHQLMTDINQDQKTDLCLSTSTGVNCQLSSGTAFTTAINVSDVDFVRISPRNARFMDINGDGLGDLCGFFEAGLQCQLNQGLSAVNTPSFGSLAKWSGDLNTPFLSRKSVAATLRFADLNNDGLIDFCARDDKAVKCAYNNGLSFEPMTTWLTLGADYGVPDWEMSNAKSDTAFDDTFYLFDWNQDGKADLCSGEMGNIYSCGFNQQGHFAPLSKVSSFVSSPNITQATGVELGKGSQLFGMFHGSIVRDTGHIEFPRHTPFQWADINGDAVADMCYRGASGVTCSLGQDHKYQKLVGITSGLGTSTQVEYGDLKDPSIYQTLTSTDASLIAYTPAQWVVKSVKQSDGVGEMSASNYTYAGVFYELGVGRTPFSQIQKNQPMFNQTYTTDYYLTGNLQSRVKQRQTHTNKRLTKDTTYGFSTLVDQAMPKIVRVRAAKTQVQNYDLLGADLGSVTTEFIGYDHFDNVTNTRVTTSGAGLSHSLTTLVSYQNNTSAWILGLPVGITRQAQQGSDQRSQAERLSYDAKGNLITQVKQPSDALAHTTNYTYDAKGNLLQVVASSLGATRRTSHSYASNGIDMLTRTNALGHQESWGYDAACGLPNHHTNANGLITTFSYDSYCRKVQQTLPTGGNMTWAYAYGQGQSGDLLLADHSVYSITTTATQHPSTTAYFDALGREVRTKTQGFNKKTVYQDSVYDNKGLKAQENMPYFEGHYPGANANWHSFEYDDLLRLKATYSPSATGVETSRTSYTGLSQTLTDAKGIARTTGHNVLGQIVSVTEGNGASQMSYTYSAFGQLLSSNANGIVISHVYDGVGNKVETQDPSLGRLSYAYNGFGEVVRQTDDKGQSTLTSYDALGRVINQSDPSATYAYQFDQGAYAKGQLNKVTTTGTAGDHTRTVGFNNKGLPYSEVESIEGVDYTTLTDYDGLGRVAKVTLPDGIKYQQTYALGQLDSIQVPKQQIWDHNYLLIEQGLAQSRANIRMLVERMHEASRKEVEYGMAAEQLMATAHYWLAQNKTLSAQANSLRQQAASLQALANNSRNTASSYRTQASHYLRRFGNTYFKLVSTSGYYRFSYAKDLGCAGRNRSGRCTRRAYQNNYFNVSKSYAAILGESYFIQGWQTRYSKFGPGITTAVGNIMPHDFYTRIANHHQSIANGKQAQANAKTGQANSVQSQANRASSEYARYKGLAAQKLAQAKKLTGELASYRDQLTTQQATLAQLLEREDAHANNADTITVWSAVNRDATGRLSAQLHGNTLVTHQTVDPFNGRLTNVITSADITTPSVAVRNLSYSYDANNNIVGRIDTVNGVTESYTYDAMERVTAHKLSGASINATTHYGYDARGNMTHKSDAGTMQYDSANRLLSLAKVGGGNSQYQYDANGNQTQGNQTSASWNAFNKVASLYQNDHTSQMTYGAFKKRIQQKEIRRDGSSHTTVYVNAGFEHLTIQAANGQVTRQSTHTFYAEGQPVAIHVRRVVGGAKTADQFRYLHRDPLDSIDTITDANMNVQERLSYGPFGQRRQANGQSLVTPTRNTTKGYTGHEHLDQVTLINMNARLYDPITTRFLSPDTLVPWPTHSQAHNRYIYVMNNPLKYNDPSGHQPEYANQADANHFREARGQEPLKITAHPPSRRDGSNNNNPVGASDTGGQASANVGVYVMPMIGPGAPSSFNGYQFDPFAQQKGRIPGKVYVTGHRVGTFGPYHTALEYDDGIGVQWISAGPEGTSLEGFEKLVGGVGNESNGLRRTDRPILNKALSVVAPPKGVSAGEYFNTLTTAVGNYSNLVDYDMFPGISNSYNSNSYVSGLLNATGGTSSVNMSGFVGGGKPLPKEHFGY